MPVRKYTDWASWWDGLRTNLIKCIGTTGIAWLGTNAASGIGIPVVGITWKQALCFFGVHIGFEVFSYFQKVQPAVIVETTETEHESRDPLSGGVTEVGSSKTTTTTPIAPLPEVPKEPPTI